MNARALIALSEVHDDVELEDVGVGDADVAADSRQKSSHAHDKPH